MKHFDEDKLTAYLLDEMGAVKRFRMKRHLRGCLRCQARLAEIRVRTNQLVAAYTDQTFPGSTRTDQARRRFFERYEREFRPAVTAPSRPVWPRWSLAMAATVVTTVAVLFAMWQREPFSPEAELSEASALIAQVELAHAALLKPSSIVRQQFRLRESIVGSSPSSRETRVEAWTDVLGGRIATRWTELDGNLILGVWQSRSDRRRIIYDDRGGRKLVHSSERSPAPLPLLHATALAEAPEGLEVGLGRWLLSRPLEPIALWRGQGERWDGEGVRVANLIINGIAVRRLSVDRVVDGRRVALTLDIDAATDQVLRKMIRLETPDRAFELEIGVENSETLPLYRLDEAVFEPDASLRSPAPAATLAPAETVPPPEADRPTGAEVDLAEMGIRVSLHGLGVCLGDPIEVVRRPASVAVRGLAESVQRRDEITRALAELASEPFVEVDVQTVEELLRRRTHSPQTPARRLPEVSSTNPRSLVKPVTEALGRYFDSTPRAPGAEPDTPARFSSRAVSLSQSVRREAWALERLARRYGDERLSPDQQAELRAMLQEHLSALRADVQLLASLLQPALVEFASESSAVSRLEPPAAAGDAWAAQVNNLFEIVQQVDGLTATLFAGAWSPEPALDALEGAPRQLAGEVSRLLLARLDAARDQAIFMADLLHRPSLAGEPVVR